MNFEYHLHLSCSRSHFRHHEKLEEADFLMFTRDAEFSGLREGALTNGGSYLSGILPVTDDGDNGWGRDDGGWPSAARRRLRGFEIVVEDGTMVYRKRYPLIQFRSRALEKFRRATARDESLPGCGTLRYFLTAIRNTAGAGSDGRTRTAATQSRIRVHTPSDSPMTFQNGAMPDVVLDEAENISPRERLSLQKDFPVYLQRTTLDRIRQHARVNSDREVAGFLLGRVFQDTSSEIFMVVDDQIEAFYTEASLTDITITARSWTAFWEELNHRDGDRRLVGWWHSHPFDLSQTPPGGEVPCPGMEGRSPARPLAEDANGASRSGMMSEQEREAGIRTPRSSVFFSSQDVFIHDHFFSWPHQIALVVDPALGSNDGIGVWGWRDGVVEMRTAYVFSREVAV